MFLACGLPLSPCRERESRGGDISGEAMKEEKKKKKKLTRAKKRNRKKRKTKKDAVWSCICLLACSYICR